MPREDLSREDVTAGLVAHAADLGFPAPPVPVRLTLAASADHWTIFIQPTRRASAAQIIDWLAPLRPLRAQFGTSGTVLADLPRPAPAFWRTPVARAEVDALHIDPDGEATLTVRGSRAGIATFTRRLHAVQAPAVLTRLAHGGASARLLTPPQEEALRAALALGYYRIPRALNLQQLAAQLHIGSASVSERLRRAEARLVTSYLHTRREEDGWVLAPHGSALQDESSAST
jgi:hypothetical protein